MGYQVRTNGDLAAIYGAGQGYVFNWYTTGPTAAHYSLLHTASCRTLPQMFAGPPTHAPRRKYFFSSAADAQAWLSQNVGAEGQQWSRCRVCHATRTSAVIGDRAVPASASGLPQLPSVQAPAPRTSVHHAYFARPGGSRLQLRVKPELESFDRREAPGQRRLQHYLDDTLALLRPHYPALGSVAALALRLDVGLPGGVSLLTDRDLDNYLAPLARRLNDELPGRIVTAWATKQRADHSHVLLSHAVPLPPGTMPSGGLCFVETTASSETDDFKQQIADRISTVPQLPYGPVRVQISFTVGPSRNWIKLWKPAIDSLVPLLGRDPHGTAKWSPTDGRITDLALHLHIDRTLGYQVRMALAAELIEPARTHPHYRALPRCTRTEQFGLETGKQGNSSE